MVQYTADFLASARHGYENTDQPMRELARELGIGITTLSTLAEKHGWAKRSQRKRGLPPAMQLLAEAQALVAATLPPRSGGEGRRASNDASRGGGILDNTKEPPPLTPPRHSLRSRREGKEPRPSLRTCSSDWSRSSPSSSPPRNSRPPTASTRRKARAR